MMETEMLKKVICDGIEDNILDTKEEKQIKHWRQLIRLYNLFGTFVGGQEFYDNVVDDVYGRKNYIFWIDTLYKALELEGYEIVGSSSEKHSK